MTNKNIFLAIAGLIAVGLATYMIFFDISVKSPNLENLDPTPQNATISGTYVCLPHMNTTGPQTTECAFGIETDSGEYYAVNFGQSGVAMEQFHSGAHIKAEGFVVIKESLNTDQWKNYNMKGIFTITRMLEPTTTSQVEAKININVVCEGALAYMTFTDSKAANTFVAECKEGKHPEVIEQYRKQLNLGAGVQI